MNETNKSTKRNRPAEPTELTETTKSTKPNELPKLPEPEIVSSNAINDFKSKLLYDEKSKNTINKYLHDVKMFCTFVGTRKTEKNTVVEFKAWLGKRYKVSSANSVIAAVNAFLGFVGSNEFCIKQFKVQKKAFCSEKRELSKEEYMCLIKAAEKKHNDRLKLIIQTICGTGIRVSELKYITVEAVYNGEAVVTCKNKTRTVFISGKLRKKLLNYIKRKKIKSGCVFVTKNGNPVDRSNVWREMKKLCKEAGVLPDKVFPHNLRHLFARMFYDVDKDIAKLADVLGHSSINTTRLYIMSSGKEHRRIIEKMNLFT